MRPILDVLAEGSPLPEMLSDALADLSAARGATAPVIAELAGARTGEVQPLQVAMTATGREADELAVALRGYLPDDAIAVLPAWETLPHERLSPRSDTVAKRISVFRRLAHPEEFAPLAVLIVPVRAMMQPVVGGLGDLTEIGRAHV